MASSAVEHVRTVRTRFKELVEACTRERSMLIFFSYDDHRSFTLFESGFSGSYEPSVFCNSETASTQDEAIMTICSTQIAAILDFGAISLLERNGLSCARQALKAAISQTMLCNEFGASFQPDIRADAALEILKAAARMPVTDAITESGSIQHISTESLRMALSEC